MRVVALISGGKDSCYNMLQCVAAGHDIVALANLRPENKDELDSYMYQTVGHQGVELYAEAMGLPLFRQPTQGVALQQDQVYTPTPEDEVEDLFQLLKTVKEEVDVDAVAVGAILSDYQRIRVENVCTRLGLVALAYLWRRDQEELLQEMIDCQVKAIVIKVAALGLSPSKHLGITLAELQPHIVKMKEKYGLNICGEGGEYETFTLDCPLFTKTVVIDEWETVIHSSNAIAPVGYLNFKSFHLVEKDDAEEEDAAAESDGAALRARLAGLPVKTWRELISDLDEDVTEGRLAGRPPDGDEADCEGEADHRPEGEQAEREGGGAPAEPDPDPEPPLHVRCETAAPLPDAPSACANDAGWAWFGGVVGHGEDPTEAARSAFERLTAKAARRRAGAGLVSGLALAPPQLVSVALYVRDMGQYAALNAEYARALGGVNPPVRACVQAPLPAATPLLLEAVAYRAPAPASASPLEPGDGGGDGDAGSAAASSPPPGRHTMHVQSVSHWAPANIGPYSQAVRVGDIIYVAGQIPLVPGTMRLVAGGARKQCRLALRHVGRIVRAVDANTQLRDVVQGICYVTHPSYIPDARREWEKRTNNAIVDYVVVPQLPRGALLEWHIWAHRHNNRFEYEETGCCIGDFRVSIRRRWNYENNVSAVVCYVSATGTGSLTAGLEAGGCGSCPTSSTSTPALSPQPGAGPEDMSEEQLEEVLSYALAKLLHKAAPADPVCSLRVFYKVGAAPPPERIHVGLVRARGCGLVHTIVPVCQLHNAHTFLSICGVRHN